jgi:hypothetical protein
MTMPGDDQQERWEAFVCPRCRALRLADGCEDEHGPPECNHGLLFGSTPDGGGESEMQPVTVAEEQATRQSARAEARAELAAELRALDFSNVEPGCKRFTLRLAESLASVNEGKADGNGG